jgi:hypothetical protein
MAVPPADSIQSRPDSPTAEEEQVFASHGAVPPWSQDESLTNSNSDIINNLELRDGVWSFSMWPKPI